MIRNPLGAIALAALALHRPASADTLMRELEGEFKLVSSTTAPVSKWRYAKGHVSVKKLDDGHLLILFACEWKSEPRAVCGDYYFAQQRGEDLWLQDMNTEPMRIYFEPASRTLTIVSRGFDSNESVRRDVFKPAEAPLEDAALLRRMKRQQAGADSKDNLRVFGHYSTWAYTKNRIEPQRN